MIARRAITFIAVVTAVVFTIATIRFPSNAPSVPTQHQFVYTRARIAPDFVAAVCAVFEAVASIARP